MLTYWGINSLLCVRSDIVLYISVLLPSIFALFALYKKKLTLGGISLAWVLGIIITYCGGIGAFIALGLTFILTILSDKIKNKEETEVRNIYQIISNVLTATLCTILYFFIKDHMFIVMYYAVISSSLADTLASSIGYLSKEKPRNSLSFKIMTKGESGAVTFLGVLASFMAGFIIATIYYLVYYNIYNALVIIIMSGIGAYLDSIIGVLFQAKYKCIVCHKQVEEKVHHKKKTKLIKGYPAVDNNMVNLLNNILVFIITFLILKK